MKRCPTCNRTFTDPNLSYCTDDGTPLTTDFADDAYRPPSVYVPPGAMPSGKQRRAWPWAVGILGAFVLGAVGLMIAAAILVPRMVRSRQADRPVVATTEETEQPVNVEASAPTDEQQVLAQLTDIEHQWTAANLNADKKKLDRILADDYVGEGEQEGTLQGKKEYIANIRRNTTIERWEFGDVKVDLSGNRATLTGHITYFARGEQVAFNFIDKFVWRDGRWQATASDISERK
jgi:Domain of unknown function (DUF4440)